MAQVGPKGSAIPQPISQLRPPVQAAPPPAYPLAAPVAGDRLEAAPARGTAALPSLALIEVDELNALRSQLPQASVLIARCESLAQDLPPASRKAFESLQALLAQPESLQDTLSRLSEDAELDPAVSAYLAGIMHQMTTVLNAGQQGNAQAFKQALSTPVQAGASHALPLANALQHLQQTLRFDQALQRQAGRELLIPNVNQAFAQGIALLDAGTSLAQIDTLVQQRMQHALGQQNKELLTSLVKGEVQQSIASMQQNFASNLKTPGFYQALQQAMTDAGLPPEKIARLGDANVIGKMPIEELEKMQKSLSRQLQALPADGSQALRLALNSTLQQDFPRMIAMRTDFQQFRVTMQAHVGELVRDLGHFSRSSGLELPPALLANLESDPLSASKELDSWIDARRAGAVGNAGRGHALDGLEQFAMQLSSGAAILDQVEHGSKIDASLMEGYERFQTFILAKRALIQTFDQADGDKGKPLRNAILEFGNRFAELQDQNPAEMQKQLFAWLGQYLDQTSLQELEQQIHSLHTVLTDHNQRMDAAHDAGVELVPPGKPPAADFKAQAAHQKARLGELARRESAYYQELLNTIGEAGLRQQLRQDLELLLDPMARSMESLSAGNLPQAALTSETGDTRLAAAGEQPVPSLEQLDTRLTVANSEKRLAAEVESIKRDLIRSVRDTRQQSQALAAARRLRDQLQNQIFDLHNQRQQEAGRHRLDSLQAIAEQLSKLLKNP